MSLTQVKTQFDKAYQLVCKIAGEVPRSAAFEQAKELLREYPHKNTSSTGLSIKC